MKSLAQIFWHKDILSSGNLILLALKKQHSLSSEEKEIYSVLNKLENYLIKNSQGFNLYRFYTSPNQEKVRYMEDNLTYLLDRYNGELSREFESKFNSLKKFRKEIEIESLGPITMIDALLG